MNPAQHILVSAIRAYRWTISPAQFFIFGAAGGCRFTPTCSRYAIESIATHGAITGSFLGLKRICRCHPWGGGGGHDPVPKFRIQDSAFRTSPKPTP